MPLQIILPERLASKLKELNVDPEAYVIDSIVRGLKLNPRDVLEVRVELAERFLEEGKQLMDEDPVQASEKLYKAAEECIKALAIQFKLEDILSKVEERGRWTVTELEKCTSRISDKLGKWFYDAWAQANYLHVWGFHEAKLDSEDVRRRAPDINKMVEETRKALGKTT